MPYGNANQIVREMAAEVLPVVRRTPVLAGVCGTDPFLLRVPFLKELKELGFSGIQNFPTVGLIDGVLRQNLEETGMSYRLEVDLVAEARQMDVLTTPYVFNEEEARWMATAGADLVVAHMGLTTKGMIGATTSKTLDACVIEVGAIARTAKAERSDVLVLCHGGPIAQPEDAQYILERCPEVDGFYGASSMERLPTEVAITEQVRRFHALQRGGEPLPCASCPSSFWGPSTPRDASSRSLVDRALPRPRDSTSVTVDVGTSGSPAFVADVLREEVLARAGTSVAEVSARGDRGHAVTQAALGAAALVADLAAQGRVEGILALGGSAGTTIGTTAMHVLPFGVPKVMISTLASGQTRPFVGGSDLVLFPSVADLAGLNRITQQVMANASAALAGMVRARRRSDSQAVRDRPVIAATMFGVTTPCVDCARLHLERADYEVVVFHATGVGGQAMEGLVRDGQVAGVLDLTTTELADELVGGILSAGPNRLRAAAEAGIPQVVSTGALDMVNFGPKETVPDRFQNRRLHVHNANVTLMRTTAEENAQLGRRMAEVLATAARGPTVVLTSPARRLGPRPGRSAFLRSRSRRGPVRSHPGGPGRSSARSSRRGATNISTTQRSPRPPRQPWTSSSKPGLPLGCQRRRMGKSAEDPHPPGPYAGGGAERMRSFTSTFGCTPRAAAPGLAAAWWGRSDFAQDANELATRLADVRRQIGDEALPIEHREQLYVARWPQPEFDRAAADGASKPPQTGALARWTEAVAARSTSFSSRSTVSTRGLTSSRSRPRSTSGRGPRAGRSSGISFPPMSTPAPRPSRTSTSPSIACARSPRRTGRDQRNLPGEPAVPAGPGTG